MPQAQALTIPAASVTELTSDEVFSVVDRVSGSTTFRSVSGGVSMQLAKRLTVKVNQPSAASKYYRVSLALVVPQTVVDSSGDPVDSFANRADIVFQIDKRSTLANAQALTERMLAFLADSSVQTAVNNAENFY